MKELLDRYISSLTIGGMTQHKNLAVTSLLLKEQSERDYLVLEEALSSGLKIGELKSASVQEVDVANETGHDILIVLGEYLIGGGQNRQAASSIFLAKDYRGKIPVQCIQHGRWNPSPGKRFASGGYSTPSTRASSSRGQQAVWQSVDETSERTQCFSQTQNLDEVYEKQKGTLEEYISKFPMSPGQAGLVAVIGLNGKKMFTADIFDSPKTFESHYAALIKAHALEALGRPVGTVSVAKEEVMDFMTDFMKANPEQTRSISLGTEYKLASRDSEGTALINAEKVRYASMTRVS